MSVNGAFFGLGSLTLQSGASVNRVFNASSGGGISLTLGFTNQSTATQTFNVPIGVDASTVNFVSTSTGNTSFTQDFYLNNNTAAFGGSGNFTISGVASGTNGGITKSGAGTLTLSGNNTFGGVLTVADGKLTVSSINNANAAGVLGNSANAVVLGANGQTGFLHYVGSANVSSDKAFTAAAGGTAGIEVSNAATALTLSGAIGGSGAVQKGGAGTLIFSGNNTFGGALNIHDGTVQVAALGGLGNGTSIGIGKSDTENISTLRYTGVSATTTKNISMNSSNNVSGIIDVATSGATLTVEGQISGTSGLTKAGAGRLNLTTNNSAYHGPITVSAGILAINGSTGNSTVSVSSGATLEGSGTVGGSTTIRSGATHSPGNSPGLQTFSSGLTYSSGSTFVWELTANTVTGRGTSFDGVNVTGGTLTINSGVTNNLVFNSSGSGVQWSNSFWGSDQTWLVFSNANSPSLSSPATVFETLVLSADSGGTQLTAVRPNASFSWRTSGNELYLDYAAVPEPSTYALLALSGIAFGGYVIRRRHRR